MLTLDEWVPFKEKGANKRRGLRKFTANANPDYDWAHEPALDYTEASVIISQDAIDPAGHYPVLDIDIPHQYYPSSTEGHGHLYFDVRLSWREYKKLLKALVRAGIIEQGYYEACKGRKYTSVRLPWVKKDVPF